MEFVSEACCGKRLIVRGGKQWALEKLGSQMNPTLKFNQLLTLHFLDGQINRGLSSDG